MECPDVLCADCTRRLQWLGGQVAKSACRSADWLDGGNRMTKFHMTLLQIFVIETSNQKTCVIATIVVEVVMSLFTLL